MKKTKQKTSKVQEQVNATKVKKNQQNKKKAAPTIEVPIDQIKTCDKINEAVHEYLLKSGLFKTVDSFRVSVL